METLDLFVIDKTITLCKWILELFNYIIFTGNDRLIGIDGSGGLWVGDSCNGISLFILFTGFIVAYKGNWKYKLVYIFLGIISIELMNVLRLVGLAILDTYNRAWTEFNHSYTFTIFIYSVIFILWIIWVNKFSNKVVNE